MTGNAIRRLILEQSYRAHHGHIGCSLSVADILAALYGQILKMDSPSDPHRDYIILSKGHAALGLYSALYLKGWLSQSQLDTYCGENSWLGVHPEFGLPGVEWSTGSLGQGLSVAAGMALANRLRKHNRQTYVLMSDAECNEGSVWEAAMFASHHALNNLIVFIDWNGQQALGNSAQILDQSNLLQRWKSFGWCVEEIDGHNIDSIVAASKNTAQAPKVILAKTIFGKGVSFMENEIKWHYLPLTVDDYKKALDQIGSTL